jgi:hypothetical protein
MSEIISGKIEFTGVVDIDLMNPHTIQFYSFYKTINILLILVE